MKNLIYILSILFSININAQITPPPNNPTPSVIFPMGGYGFEMYQENCYIKDLNNKLDVWEGTWEYNDGITVFRIVLEKVPMYYNQWSPVGEKWFSDELFGGYYYEVNNVVISDQSNYDTAILYPVLNPIIYSSTNDSNTILRLRFNDPLDNNSRGYATLVLLPGSPTQATWTIINSYPHDDIHTIPTTEILTKL